MLSPRAIDTTAAPARLSPPQFAIVVTWGLIVWLAAALLIRWAPRLFDGGVATLAIFVAGAVSAWPLVWGTERAAGLRPDQVVTGTAIASAAAMLADGVGLVWSPLYAVSGAAPLAAAAWLLWGVAWLVIAASVRSR